MERRVVITCESSITPIGRTEEQILNSLTNGISGIKKIKYDELLDSKLKSRVFGTVDYEIEYDFKRKHSKTLGPVGYRACYVAGEVLRKSGLSDEFIRSGRLGVSYGSNQGSPTIQRELYKSILFDKDDSKFSSAGYIQQMAHTTAVNISQMYGITGRTIASCTACTTGSQAIGFGYEAIKYGLQDVMLCGSAEEYDLLTVAVFDKLISASTMYNDTPDKTPRPFDKNRDGLVVGEGAGALLLEEYEFAKKRGVSILGEVIGFACRNNGGDLLHPSVEGIENTVKSGLENAKISYDMVDFVSAHATSTPVGDAIESQAIYNVYKDKPLVSGLKSYVGHTMGACGVLETIFTLYMMKNNVVVPTLNLDEIDENCKMINHTGKLKEVRINIASIQNFAFGGVNSIIFIKRFE
jgi:3-oxoacyl-[acyl-carrier-protein] synthase II